MSGILIGILGVGLCAQLAMADPPQNIFDFSKPKKPPATAPATPPVTPTAPQPPTAPPAAPPIAPETPAPTPVAAPAKLPVPSAASLSESSKLIAELFADDIAKATTVDKKAALSAKMLQAGIDEKDDMVGKFTLLQRSKELAIDIGDFQAAEKSIDELSNTFAINVPQMEVDSATAVSKSIHVDRSKFAADAQTLADSALNNGEFDTAKSLSDLAVSSARMAHDSQLLTDISARAKSVSDAQADYAKVRQADATLKLKPADPDANLKIGRFRCFIQDDWSAGLPNLALGSDPVLKKLAAAELKGGLDAAGGAALADGWWSVSSREAGHAKLQIRSHAGRWYEASSADLTGLTKVRAEKRSILAEAADNLLTAQPNSNPKAVDRALTRLLNDPDHWKTINGDWTNSTGHLRGAGDSNIEFDTPLPAEISLSFHINVIDGMRPRMHFIGTDMMFGNEGFSLALFPHGTKATAPPFPYKNKEPHVLAFKISKGHFDIAVDGKSAFTGSCKVSPSIRFKLSGGDSWSRGTTEYSDFQVGSGSAAESISIVPSTQLAIVAAASNQKLPVPAAPLLVEAQQMISELFADDIEKASTIDGKAALSDKLLQLAKGEHTEIPAKFVLFRQSKDIAVSAGDLTAVCKVIDETSSAFVINPDQMKQEAAVAMAKSALTDHKKFANDAAAMADNAMDAGNFDLAKSLSDAALMSARQAQDAQLLQTVTARSKRIADMRTTWDQVKPALVTLKLKPEDPDANLKVGRFRCFVQNDWEAGLPDLAKGNDAIIKAAATAELKATDATTAVSIADSWWTIGDKEPAARLVIHAHAGEWYEKAQPNLTGLTRALVDKRLSEVRAAPAPATPPSHGSTGSQPIDLLSHLSLDTQTVQGKWSRDETAIVSDRGEFTRVDFNYHPPLEYDYKAVFQKLDGNDGIDFVLFAGGRQFTWSMSGWQNTICGFGELRGKFTNENQTTVKDFPVNPSQTYTCIIKVRANEVSAYVDGQKISELATDYQDLCRAIALHRADTIGVSTFKTSYRISQLEVTDITGTGKFVSADENDGVSVLATMDYTGTGSLHRDVKVFSNGHFDTPTGEDRWFIHQNEIDFRWREYLDTCTLSADRRSFAGHNLKGEAVHGALASGSFPASANSP